MPDREKVIRDIERCADHAPDACRECSKYGGGYELRCMEHLMEDALALLKEQESEWLEDSDPGQEYGSAWACRKCMHSIHKPYIWNPYDSGYKYCFHCGAKMEVKLDD